MASIYLMEEVQYYRIIKINLEKYFKCNIEYKVLAIR